MINVRPIINALIIGLPELLEGDCWSLIAPRSKRYFRGANNDNFQPRIDRESPFVGLPEDLNAKTDQLTWADFELADTPFGEFDKLINDFEIELG